MDGTSLSIVFRDLAMAYEGTLGDGEGPLYSNYITHLQGQLVQPAIDYWSSYLKNVEPCHFPVLDDGNVVESKELRYVRVHFEELTALQSLCEQLGVTISNAIYTAWALTLRYYVGSEEVCFGYLTSARDGPIEGVRDLVGPVINMLACRVNVTDTTNLMEIMSQVQKDYLDCLEFRHVPLAEVQHALHLSNAALFNTALSYRKLPPQPTKEPLISFTECAPTYDPDEYNVSINIEAGDKEMAVDLMYWTDTLSDEQAANVASTFTKTLSNILHHSEVPVAKLDCLSQRNREHITRWSGQMPDAVEDCVHNIIKAQSVSRPNAPAIASHDEDYTYAELDEVTTRLAHHLSSIGVGPEVFVLVCFEKSAFTIVAMLAILKAGGACVPLDPAHPKAALQLRADDTQARIALVSSKLVGHLQGIVPHVLAVDAELLGSLPSHTDTALVKTQPGNACFIIYTSGSTGKPKGVVLEHRGITTSAKYHGPLLGYEQDSRVLQFASYTFDNSLAEMFTTLMRGGCVCVPSDHERLNDLAGAINRMKVTFVDITPTVATFLEPTEVPTLKRVALGGEAVTKRCVEIWRDYVSLHCCYGPSECSINSTYSGEIAQPGKATNIGRAIGSVAWVVDPNDYNRLLPVGCVGELLIDGPIVSRGYLHLPEKTAESFIKNPVWLSQFSEGDASQRPIYKTGDLVRYDSDGTIMYLGRKDTQVKLNGQRIELGEIEHHIEKNLPADAQSAVEMVSFDGKKSLACFVCLEPDGSVPDASEEHTVMPMSETFKIKAKDLEVALTAKIPVYMVPTVWLPIWRMPLTSSGKTNRRGLRLAAQAIPSMQLPTYKLASKSGRAPSSEIELTIASMWAKVLGIEASSIGVEDSFFKLGGDSIGAMRLVTAARSADISLTVSSIFQKSTLLDMVEAAAPMSKITNAKVEPFSLLRSDQSINRLKQEIGTQIRVNVQSIEDIYPCTTIQEGLMALSNKEPGAYVAQLIYRLPSDIDVERFRQAWESVVQVENVLRTRIVFTENHGFLQVVVKEPLTWNSVSHLSGLDDSDRRLPAYNGAEITRYTMVGEKTSSPHFVWTVHHALYDGWSLPLVLEKVKTCYNATSNSRVTSGPPYANFIKHITEVDLADADRFWESKLANMSAQQFPRLPNPTYQANASSMLTHKTPLTRHAGSGITMATIIRAAWAIVVAAQSGSSDVVFWETVTGRDAPVQGIEDMLGATLATIPTRVQVEQTTTVQDYLKNVQAQSAEVMTYQYTGIQRIKRLNSETAIACGAQNLIAINSGGKDAPDDFWDERNNEMAGTNFYTYPLMLSCNICDGEIETDAHYDQEVISAWYMERLMDQFGFMLKQMTSSAADHMLLGQLGMISEGDAKILKAWNGNMPSPIDRCVQDMIQDQVRSQPETKDAICSWDGTLTYRSLDTLSDRLAAYLLDNGVGNSSIVPLCFEKSAWTVVSMVAVLKAGGAFVPLDPAHPEARLKGIIADVESDIILCSSKHVERCQSLVSKVVAINQEMIHNLPSPGRLPRLSTTNGAAYIIFTSGTTGKPKGTIIEHAAFCTGAVAHGTVMEMNETSRVLQFASHTFDASIMEILTTLIMGGTVCIPTDEARLNNIAGAINEMGVNWALLTPSFAQMIQPSSIPQFKTLVLGGEAMSRAHISTWSGAVRLMNAYGPSETSVVAAINSHVTLKCGPSNIGAAVGGRCWITDADNHDRLVPLGSVGELVVEGPILARGYLKNPQKTAESFITNPKWAVDFPTSSEKAERRMYKTGDLVKYEQDGTLNFQGRKDTQVKLYGQRLELSEVEHHLSADAAIQHAIAAIPKVGPCQKRLVAVLSLDALAELKRDNNDLELVSREGAASYLAGIRERIATLLPPYMVPSKWIVLHQLPLLPSGKLDRRMLSIWIDEMSDQVYQQISDAETSSAALDREATNAETGIRMVWAKVLNLPAEKIPFTQSFLHLGGDSISAMQVMASCRSQNIAVTVPQIMQSKSIVELASKATVVEETIYEAEEIEKAFDLSPIQQMYFECMCTSSTQFNQSVLLKLGRKTGPKDLTRAIHSIVNAHSMLRARFTKSEAGVWQQRITQDVAGSYRIRTHLDTQQESLPTLIEESQRYLDIVHGPLLAVDIFDIQGAGHQIITLVAHHLVIDVVSWHIILEDLETLVRSDGDTLPVSLPFQTWNNLQAEQAQRQNARSVFHQEPIPPVDLSYWGMDGRPNVHGDVITESFELDTQTTLSLLGPCHKALQTEPVDIFLAAILGSFSQTFTDRLRAPAIYNEGHGREPWDVKLDLSRTVGWFTTLSPVFLPEVSITATSTTDLVRWIKDFRAKVPDKGRPFFAHRYMSEEGKAKFSNQWPVEMAFNYLGQTSQLERDDAIFQSLDGSAMDSLSAASDIGHDVPRLSLFEISASVVGGSLSFSFSFNRHMKHQNTIKQWVRECRDFLTLATSKLSKMKSEPTMSDFPLLPLTYNGVAKLEEKLPQMNATSIKDLEDAYPCSPVQQGILFTQIKNPDYYAYSVAFEAKPTQLGVPVDMHRLADAWQMVCKRHASLRTVFVDNLFQEGQMDQVVLRDVPPKIRCLECSNEEVPAILLKQTSVSAPENQPPHRLTICKDAEGRVFCYLEMSHALCDGTSMPILFQDLALAYEGVLSLTNVPLYSDYIAYMQQAQQGHGLDYWKAYLADIEPCYFPVLNDGFVEPKTLLAYHQELTCANELQPFCTRNGITLSNLFQLAWALTLQAYTGLDDVCFGYLVAGRDLPVPGIDEAIGVFINMLTCRVQLPSATTIRDVLKGIQNDLLAGMSHQHVSLADVQHELNIGSAPLFNTAYSFQKRMVSKAMTTGPLSFDVSKAEDPSEYDITVNVEVWDASAEVELCYWTDKISEAQARNISTTLDQILGSIVRHHDAGKTIGDIDLISSHCIKQLTTWNHSEPEAIEKCVHHVIESNAQRQPSTSQAVCAWDANFTYKELDILASRLAVHLVSLGIKPEMYVPLMFEKSAWTIVSMLGVLKAGAAFVPLDSNHPRERISYLVESVDAKVVLCSTHFTKKFEGCNVQTMPINKKTMADLSKRAVRPVNVAVTPQNPAYIIFTSGTTGLPKGTIIEHGAFTTGGIAHAAAIKMRSDSRVLQFASHTFDASIMEILSTLLVGGCICIPSEQDRMNDLTACISKLNITWTLLTPSVANVLKPGSVPTLKVLVTGGEAMSKDHITKWANEACLVNAYGPSETSVIAATSTKVDENGIVLDRDPACIGEAVGSRCWVVDQRNHNRLMPIGSIGELLVEGRIVARGYLKNEEKTKDAFINSPSWRAGLQLAGTRNDRIYKTGDLVRLSSDGSIIYLGRKDTQIKLNGQRIELGEIEHHVKVNLPEDVQSTVDLVVPQSKTSAKALAAFFSCNEHDNDATEAPVSEVDDILLPMSNRIRTLGEALKSALENALPAYMVPTVYVPVTKMPWTTAGKLDRNRLRAIVNKIPMQDVALYKLASASKKRAPSTPMEKKLAKVWEKVLRLDAGLMSKDDSFFRIGGDSISAMQLVAAARTEQIALTVLNVFRHSKLADMATFCGAVGNDAQAGIKPFSLLKGVESPHGLLDELADHCQVNRSNIQDAYPSSSLQEGLITLSMRQAGAYVAKNVFEVTADIDLVRFKDAWQKTVEQVDILRSRMVHSKSAKFYQVVLDAEPIHWASATSLKEAMEEERPIPASNGAALTQYTIIEDAAVSKRYLLWTVHHALYDAWSMPAMLKMVEANYTRQQAIEPSQPFASFVKYLSEIDNQASDDFWKTKFEGAAPSHFPPIISATKEESTTNTMLKHEIKYSKDAVGMDITVPTIIRAAWAMVVGSQTGSDDVIFGETLSGRDIAVDGITDILGPTLTTVPTRIEIDRSKSVSGFLKSLHEQAADVIPYQHAGLQNIKRLGQDIAIACDFNNLLVIQTGGEPSQEKILQPMDSGLEENFFTYPLVIECSVGRDRLELIAHYETTIIPQWQMQRIVVQFEWLVNQLITASRSHTRKINEIALCGPEDRKLIHEWNSFKLNYVQNTVAQQFLDTAALRPDALALRAWDGDFTYSQVKSRAIHFAQYLRSLGVQAESLVPACMDRSAWTTISLLGILLAGGGIVPLDPAHPPSRHVDIVEDTKARVVLCTPNHVARFSGIPGRVVAVDEAAFQNLPPSECDVRDLVLPENNNAAFVIYTSGSTGKPKGVVIEHHSFCTSSAAFGRRMAIKATSRVFHFTSYAFDIAMGETFTALTVGACLCIPSEEMRTGDLLGAINTLGATWTFLTPSVANILDPANVNTLETLVCGGEALTAETVRTWADRITLMNGYGPAECTVFAVANANVSEEKDHTNIGRAMDGGHTWIVDSRDHDFLSPVGCVGELLIEGPICARGYLNEKEKTDAAFIENPAWAKELAQERRAPLRMYKTGDLVKYNQNGSIIFMGRKDHQVKLHGQRMEIGEIEHNLEDNPRIKHAVVDLPKNGLCKGKLTAVVSLYGLTTEQLGMKTDKCMPVSPSQKQAAQKEIAIIQDELSAKLPPYMVPTAWLVVQSVPLLVSGKLNRTNVTAWISTIDAPTYKEAAGVDDSGDANDPESSTGKLLRRIWSSVLNLALEKTTINQTFISLGGDSITAMQVMSQCREQSINISMQDILRTKSIVHLAQIVDAQDRQALPATVKHVENEESFDLSPVQRLFFDLSANKQNGDQFNQSHLLRITRKTDGQEIDRAIHAVIQKHSMLRARFQQTASGAWQQRISPDAASSYSFKHHAVPDTHAIANIVGKSQACLNIIDGPLFAADLIVLEDGTQLLSLIGHHLIIDVVSWLNILQDLETFLASGFVKTDTPFSFQAWCAAQAQNAKQMELRNMKALPFKIEPADYQYWGMADKDNVYGDTTQSSFVISDKSLVEAALGTCHQALRTESIDLFISVLLHSFARTFEDRSLPTLFNEGHGREPWDSSIDLSRTVGWFTSLAPVHVAVTKPTNDVVDSLRKTKDVRRSIPSNGRPYFAHRYLTESGRALSKNHLPMEVLFNFLGRTQSVGKGESLLESFDYEKTEQESRMISDVGAQTTRLALFEVSTAITNGGIQFSFMYNKHMRYQDRIQRWVGECQAVLEDTVRSLTDLVPTPTLSDLPLLPMNYSELQRLASKTLPAAEIANFNDVEDIYPVSPMQTGILLSQLKDPGRYLFHTILEVKPPGKDGRIDTAKLAKACAEVVERHPAMRTVFINSVYRGGTFDQVVLKSADRKTTTIQCREIQVVSKLDAISLKATNEGPGPQLPYQFTICETPDGKAFLKLEMNHAVTDGASSSIVVGDIAKAYANRLPLGEAPSYREYISYLQRQSMDQTLAFWKGYLNGLHPTNFPAMNPDLAAERILGSETLTFTRYPELQALCTENGVTFSNVILVAWALVLRSYTKSEDVCFGYLASGRDTPIQGIEDIVGPFINMLVFRFRFTPTMLLKSLFLEAQEDYLSSLPHQHVSLAKVQHELGQANRSLFNTAISIQSAGAAEQASDDLISFESIVAHDPSEYSLTLNVNTTRGDEGLVFRYWTDVLSEGQAGDLSRTFAELLNDFIDQADKDVSQLRLFKQMSIGATDPSQNQNSITLDTATLQRIITDSTRETITQLIREGLLQTPGMPAPQTTTRPNALVAGALQPEDPSFEAVEPIRMLAAKKLSEEDQLRERLAEKLDQLWKEVLGLEGYDISYQDSFFELGGDSIIAMTMVGIAREEDMPLTVADVFNNPSFGDMLHCMQTQSVAEFDSASTDDGTAYSDSGSIGEDELYEPFSLLNHPSPEVFVRDYVCPNVRVFRGGIVDVLPTTDFQALAIAGSLLDSRWMLNYFYLDGTGELDLRALKHSAFTVVQNFDILRTVFIPHGRRYIQVVLRQLQPEFTVHEDVDSIEEFSKRLEQRSHEEAPRLGESYVQFIVALEKDTLRHRIFLRISHAQYDGVCFPAILDALRSCYQGEPIPVTPSFAKFVRNAVGRVTPEHYQYWQDLLRGSSMTSVVHRDRPSYNRAAGLTKTLKQVVPMRSLASFNITPATIIKAAWSLVLAQVTAKSDIVFGHIISGRNTAVSGIESIVGPCLNMVPVRVSYQASWTVLQLLRYIQNQQVANMAYESLGFREIIRKCTDWDDWTNFSTVLQHQSMAQTGELHVGANAYQIGAIASQEDFADFSVVTTPKDASSIEVCLIYAQHGPITAPFAEQVFGTFCKAIASFSADPNAALPSPSDIQRMQRQTLEDIISPQVHAPSLDSILQGLSKRELFMLSDSLSRAWNSILHEENDAKPVSTPLDSSFFKLGGDIIGLAQVATLLRNEGYKIRLEDLIDNPVMADQLALLSLHMHREQQAPAVVAAEQNKSQSSVMAEQNGGASASAAAAAGATPSEKRMSLWRKSAKLASRMVGKKSKADLRANDPKADSKPADK
jgi:amino acid adenylation domain-containing protein/non-ribosomal peptide synthase protein (TIGR01720 family)